MHADPVTPVLFALALVLPAAKLGGEAATRLGQPAVLGELLVGMLLGNLAHAGVDAFAIVRTSPVLDILARLGVIVLLFQVGLESSLSDLLRVGAASLAVAVTGVLAPFALGWGVGAFLLPGQSAYVHVFLGATLTATSVGITARVLKDLGRARSAEGRVILGAAVLDDVLGLVILAIVAGLIQGEARGTPLSWRELAAVIAKASGFLAGALVCGRLVSARVFAVAAHLRSTDVLLATALALCFGLAYAAGLVGLAPIVGAYAAGVILEPVHYRVLEEREDRRLEDLVHPIACLLVPVFFVKMGAEVDLRSFARPEVLGLAPALTLAAILGKLACALVARAPGLDARSVAIGMIPRGEVGLIFASIGRPLELNGRPVIDDGTFSAVVLMVVVTTMITPPALRWSLERSSRPSADGHDLPQSR
jgi:Kef-type K+ transport system membrane component KefB